jgi:hypothetical protein
MSENTPQIKYYQVGIGNNVAILYYSKTKITLPVSQKKIHYMQLEDLNEETIKELTQLLNKHDYITEVVIDYVIFVWLLQHIESISIFHSHLSKLIIFNPQALAIPFWRSKCTTVSLSGEEIEVRKNTVKMARLVPDRLFMLAARKVLILTPIQSNKYAFMMAARIHNALYNELKSPYNFKHLVSLL